MKQRLPWSVTGIPAEARQIARDAASRDGLPVGEWLTLRIYAEGGQSAPERLASSAPPRPPHGSGRDCDPPHDHNGPDDHAVRTQGKPEAAFHRIDDALHALGRRLDSTERAQNTANAAMSAAATELNTVAREQAKAFDCLAQRIDDIERHTDSEALRDAVRGLHQGLSRLADQIAKTATETSGQICTLAGNMDTIAGALASTQDDSRRHSHGIDARFDTLVERLSCAEERIENSELRVQQAIERQLSSIESNLELIAQRLEQTERSRGKIDATVGTALQNLNDRVQAAERSSNETLSELRPSPIEPSSQPRTARTGLISPNDSGPQPKLDVRTAPIAASPSSEKAPTTSNPQVLGAEDPQSLASVGPDDAPGAPAREEPPPAYQDQSIPETARPSAEVTGSVETKWGTSVPLSIFRENGDGGSKRTRNKRNDAVLPAAALLILILAGVGSFSLIRVSGSANGGYQAEDVSAPLSREPLNPSAQTRLPRVEAPDLRGGPLAPDNAQPAAPDPAPPSVASTDVPAAPAGRSAVPAQLSPGNGATRPAMAAPPESAAVFEPPAPAPNGSPTERLQSLAGDGSPAAALLLGLKYLDGDGVANDDVEAVRWLRQAAEQGEPLAQYRLGALYERGRGLPVDHIQAGYWYEQAARNGNSRAMHNLAVAHADGAGVKKNLAEAARWFKSAAEHGLTDSQYNLALLYERGIGVPPSLREAYTWYLTASMQGDTEAHTRVEAIAQNLPEDQRLAAERAANAYAPKPLNRTANWLPTLDQIAPLP